MVAGNWKMNHGPGAARAFFRDLGPLVPPGGDGQIVVFPPALSLAAAREARDVHAPDVSLGVQNVHWEEKGAFTGEVSVGMAREAGATHALVGHSERRTLFGERDAQVALKARALLLGGMIPVVCVGETLDERREGRVEAVILRQLDAVLEAVGGRPGGWLLAYEPVWAIGTGETATPEDASSAHGILKGRLRERFGAGGEAIPILYGGSVRPDNAAELLGAPGVDGLLVGGASLEPGSFALIVEAARR